MQSNPTKENQERVKKMLIASEELDDAAKEIIRFGKLGSQDQDRAVQIRKRLVEIEALIVGVEI